MSYEDFVSRNRGYVSPVVQSRVRSCRVLLAGCGVGSALAESLVRIGFERIILVDHDIVEAHNLNRQAFSEHDVGVSKAEALARRLRAIRSSLDVEVVDGWIDSGNAALLVERTDLVIDTIDFMSLPAIVALHDAAEEGGKPIVSGFTAGWGAAAMVFPGARSPHTFRSMFGLPSRGSVEQFSYVEVYAHVVERLAPSLAPSVRQELARVLPTMADREPCPASQVAAGSAALAALVTTMVVRVLSGEPVTAAPELILLDLGRDAAAPGVTLACRERNPL